MSTTDQKKSASVSITESSNKSVPGGKAGRAETGAKSSGQGSGNLFVNLLLLGALGIVFYTSSAIKSQLNKTEQLLQAKLIPQPQPTPTPKPTPQSAPTKKNVMCPNAQADLQSCQEKLANCRRTESEFASAEQLSGRVREVDH